MEEFTPGDWGGAVDIKPGKYIFPLKVKSLSFRDTDKEKAYMLVVFIVIDGEHKGFEFDQRIYISKKAEWRARYFLKKFDYPEEYLGSESPVLKKSVIEGLEGKALVEFEEDNYGMLKPDMKKFDHINGSEIEEYMAKQSLSESGDQTTFGGATTDAEPTKAIDVNADVKDQPPPHTDADDLSLLDD
jgi:hypothetical protein